MPTKTSKPKDPERKEWQDLHTLTQRNEKRLDKLKPTGEGAAGQQFLGWIIQLAQ